MRKADPEFYVILEKLRRVQASGAVALRVKKGGERGTCSWSSASGWTRRWKRKEEK